MLKFFLSFADNGQKVVMSILATFFVTWVIWASGSITSVSSAQAKLGVQQQALKESTDLKLDRINDKLDIVLQQHGLMLSAPKKATK